MESALGQNPFDIAGKKAVVTGAALGIGYGIARRFVQAGASVLLVDYDPKALADAMARLNQPGRTASLVQDMAAEGAGEVIVRSAKTLLGGLDVLVNNAGVYPQTPVMKMGTETLDRVLAINLRGVILACKAAAQALIDQGRGGRIINITSVDSMHPSMVGLAAYDASKGGLMSFTKNLALELAPYDILVNAIAPGGVATEGTAKPLQGSGMSPEQMREFMAQFVKAKVPLGRMGTPDEIATVAQFLASPAANYMTGASVVVDGGMLLT